MSGGLSWGFLTIFFCWSRKTRFLISTNLFRIPSSRVSINRGKAISPEPRMRKSMFPDLIAVSQWFEAKYPPQMVIIPGYLSLMFMVKGSLVSAEDPAYRTGKIAELSCLKISGYGFPWIRLKVSINKNKLIFSINGCSNL